MDATIAVAGFAGSPKFPLDRADLLPIRIQPGRLNRRFYLTASDRDYCLCESVFTGSHRNLARSGSPVG